MKIVFFHVGPDITTPTLMVESARRFSDEVVMLTDQVTPEVSGCSEVHRYAGNTEELMLFRMQAYATYNRPGMYVDTDVLIQRDPSPVMTLDFDIAVTERTGPVQSPDGRDITKQMPFNTGVIFCKHPAFFSAMRDSIARMDRDFRVWWGDQIALAVLVPQLACVKLPTAFYNRTFSPKKPPEQFASAWVLHFKGDRKPHMPAYLNKLKETWK